MAKKTIYELILEKKRRKRLIEKGAVFESLVPESKEITTEEFKILIMNFVKTDEFKYKVLEIMEDKEKQKIDEEEIENEDSF